MTMQVTHPRAGDGPGVAPSHVDVDGDRVEVSDDGTFEAPEGWVDRFADRHDVDVEGLRVGTSESDQDGDEENDENADGEDAGTESGTVPFNPESHTVPEIKDRVEELEDAAEVRALRNLEEDQQDRTTAVNALQSRLDELEE